jgi:hypothetical protein
MVNFKHNGLAPKLDIKIYGASNDSGFIPSYEMLSLFLYGLGCGNIKLHFFVIIDAEFIIPAKYANLAEIISLLFIEYKSTLLLRNTIHEKISASVIKNYSTRGNKTCFLE